MKNVYSLRILCKSSQYISRLIRLSINSCETSYRMTTINLCLVFSATTLLLLLFRCVYTTEEPVCSQFDNDKKIMEYITETRYEMKMMAQDLRKTEEYLLAVLDRRKLEMNKLEYSLKLQLEQGLLNVTERLTNLEEDVNYETVAFSAYNPADKSLQRDEILVLQSTLLNEGNGFDTKSGKFTAPTSGLYHFTAHVCNTHGLVIRYAIVKDGEWIARSQQFEQANENKYKYASCSSVSALMMLKPGEQVWIMCTSGYSSAKQFHDDSRRRTSNSFIGVLLRN